MGCYASYKKTSSTTAATISAPQSSIKNIEFGQLGITMARLPAQNSTWPNGYGHAKHEKARGRERVRRRPMAYN